jgi:hypothetical protein
VTVLRSRLKYKIQIAGHLLKHVNVSTFHWLQDDVFHRYPIILLHIHFPPLIASIQIFKVQQTVRQKNMVEIVHNPT